MSAQKPVVGRHVWFGHSHGQAVPFTATICGVNPDGTVNLGVYDFEGNTASYVGIRLIQEGEPTPEQGPFCKWPPQSPAVVPAVGPAEFAMLAARLTALESFVSTPTPAAPTEQPEKTPEKTPEKPGKKG